MFNDIYDGSDNIPKSFGFKNGIINTQHLLVALILLCRSFVQVYAKQFTQ